MAFIELNTLMFFSFCAILLHNQCYAMPKNSGGFQGMFIFGSSVVDNGNNNNLPTLAKANYPPYGIDFPLNTTGRFSNGKNLGDFIGDHLRLPLIPAFANPNTRGNAIVNGVNFASGGSGILEETGLITGIVFTLNQQILNFERVILPQLEEQLKARREEILPNYLFFLAAGNNDYLLNYFILNVTSPQTFAARLITTYSNQIKRLYNLGARNFLVLSVYPLGCSPVISRGQGCVAERNAVVTIFYNQLLAAVDNLKQQMPASRFIIVNSVNIITDIINNPQSAGLSNVTGPCCELGVNGLSCKQNGKVCEDRTSYAFFDGQHNTEAFSAILADKIYASCNSSQVYPFNLQILAHMH